MTRLPSPLALVVATCLIGFTGSAALAQKKASQANDSGTIDASGKYVLSEQELRLDCKKLNGRINVRLLQLRAELADKSLPTGVAQGLQQVTAPALKLMFGGASAYGTDRAGQLRADRAVIDGYNAQLVAKGCQPYDIATELKKGPNDPPPAPLPKTAAAKK